MHVHIELLGRLQIMKVRDDMPSESSRNATLKRNTDRLGYVKHSTEVIKHMNAETIAKDMDEMYSHMMRAGGADVTLPSTYSRDAAHCLIVSLPSCSTTQLH